MEEKDYIIWEPMRQYAGKSKQEIVQETNQYMEKLLHVYENQSSYVENYSAHICEMLREGRKAEEIFSVVKEEMYQNICPLDYTFSCFSVACEIGVAEEKNGYTPNIAGAGDMENACRRMQTIIFGLRRLEYGWAPEECEALWSHIEEWNVSYIFLAELVLQHIVVDKFETIEGVAKLYEGNHRHRDLVLFLFYLVQKLQFEQNAVFAFTNILLEGGDFYMGHEMLCKLENPSPEIVQMQKKIAERIGK